MKDKINKLFENNFVYFSTISIIIGLHIYDVLFNDRSDMIIYDTAQAAIQFPILLSLLSIIRNKLSNIAIVLCLAASFIFNWFEFYHYIWEGLLKSFYWNVLGYETQNSQFGMITVVGIIAVILLISNIFFYKRSFFKLFSFVYFFGAIITTGIFHFFIIESNYKPFLQERVDFVISLDESMKTTKDNCDLVGLDCLGYSEFMGKYTGKYDRFKTEFVKELALETKDYENHQQYTRGFDPKFQSGGTNYFVYFSKTNNEIKIVVDKEEVAKRHQRYFQSLYGLIASFNISWLLLFIYLNHLHQRKFRKF